MAGPRRRPRPTANRPNGPSPPRRAEGRATGTFARGDAPTGAHHGDVLLVRSRSRRIVVLLVAVLVASACASGSDGSTAPTGTGTTPVVTTTSPTTAPPTTGAPTSTSSSTTTTSTTLAPTTTIPATTTTTVCPPIGDRSPEQAGFPGSLSSLVGVDIRTGAHPCFERIVIEFAAGDAPTPGIVPGWWVRYTDEPITLGQTDDQFVELRGDADLLVTVEAWMYEVDAAGRPTTYAGSIDLFPTNVSTIEEIRLIDNWEGVQVWAIGLDRVRDLRVTVLTEPVRLVIDLGA